MASKTSQTQISAIEQGKLLLAELGRDFLEWKAKAIYDRKKLGKKASMSGNFNF